jgi:hypothetical protein
VVAIVTMPSEACLTLIVDGLSSQGNSRADDALIRRVAAS